MKAVAFDLDGTICRASEYRFREFGKIRHDVVIQMWLLHRRGVKLYIYTSRSWAEHDALVEWLDRMGVPPVTLVMGSKPIASAYVDDRSVDPNAPQWAKRLNQLLEDEMKIYPDERRENE